MTTEEALAIAVIKGDKTAARALADLIAESERDRVVEYVPIHKIEVPRHRIRVVLFARGFPADTNIVWDIETTTRDIEQWLAHGRPLLLQNIDRVEIYEVPEHFVNPTQIGRIDG